MNFIIGLYIFCIVYVYEANCEANKIYQICAIINAVQASVVFSHLTDVHFI
jgi:hypothetical protein